MAALYVENLVLYKHNGIKVTLGILNNAYALGSRLWKSVFCCQEGLHYFCSDIIILLFCFILKN